MCAEHARRLSNELIELQDLHEVFYNVGVFLNAFYPTCNYLASESTLSIVGCVQQPSILMHNRNCLPRVIENMYESSITGCCVALQGLLLTLCALGPQEVHEVRLGLLTPYAVSTLRHLKAFFGVSFSIKPEKESQTIFLSCIGAGVKNTSKGVT